MVEKPARIILKRCAFCQKEQRWHPDGYVITKGWHGFSLQKTDTGKRLSLCNPESALAGDSDQVICAECIPTAARRYAELPDYGATR
jgi:hypothetical protein